MYGREELKTYISSELYDRNFREFGIGEAFLKDEANKVMDAMERRIARLTALVEGWRRKSVGIEKYYRTMLAKDKSRIKELELSFETSHKHEKIFSVCFDKHIRRIKELQATISKMETTQKWISVEDVLPQWGKLVKIKFKDGKEDERRFSADYKWVSKGMQTCESVNVTHWMPLPPTTEEN